MTVHAQASLYPLRQERLAPAIDAFLQAIELAGLETHVGPMSTGVAGDTGSIFAALRAGFEQAARLGPVVLTVTISNACPVDER